MGVKTAALRWRSPSTTNRSAAQTAPTKITSAPVTSTRATSTWSPWRRNSSHLTPGRYPPRQAVVGIS